VPDGGIRIETSARLWSSSMGATSSSPKCLRSCGVAQTGSRFREQLFPFGVVLAAAVGFGNYPMGRPSERRQKVWAFLPW